MAHWQLPYRHPDYGGTTLAEVVVFLDPEALEVERARQLAALAELIAAEGGQPPDTPLPKATPPPPQTDGRPVPDHRRDIGAAQRLRHHAERRRRLAALAEGVDTRPAESGAG